MVANSNSRLIRGRNKDPLDARRASYIEVEEDAVDAKETIPFLSIEEKKKDL